jgi:acetylornithine deacetylase/succinyl-diaminopimelate desuccinylase-like protein
MIRELIEKSGFYAELIEFEEGSPIVFGDSRPLDKEKTLLLYSHYDVVPPEPLEQWVCNPYEAKIVDNKIIGRGALDAKGTLAIDVFASEAVKEVLGELPINVKFVFEGEEEIASRNLVRYLESKPTILNADAMLWEGGSVEDNGKPTIYAGLKGSLYVDLYVKTANIDQHSMWAPVIPNAAWRLIWALNSMKDEKGNIVIDGFYDDIKKPDEEDVEALKNIEFNEESYKKAFGIKQYLNNLRSLDLLKVLIFEPTCTICGFDSGYKGESLRTINPKDARVKVDFRLVPNQSCQEVFEKLKNHLRKRGFDDIELKILRMAEPVKTSLNSRIVKIVSETAKKLFNAKPSIWPMEPASAVPIACFTNGMGIPSVSGACVMHPESNVHAPNENILIPNYIKGIKHVAYVIMEF